MSRLTVPLHRIAACFEGLFPSEIASVSRDGTPNVTPLSVVHRVDDEHVALSFQFFNKTRRNVLECPRVRLLVTDPTSFREYRLDLEYLRTETEGALFESMRSRLDAVATAEGMERIFRLRGADVYRVLGCTPVDCGDDHPGPAPRSAETALVEAFGQRIASARAYTELVDLALRSLADVFGYEHSLLFVPEPDGRTLRARGAHGHSGPCSGRAVPLGEGTVGVAALRRRTVRLTNVAADIAYLRAIRERAATTGLGRDVAPPPPPPPGLAEVRSQLAVPLVAADELQGVLCLESTEPARFDEVDERLVRAIAPTLAWALTSVADPVAAAPSGDALPHEGAGRVRYYLADDSVFLDDEYLIRGVAGHILWTLLRAYARDGRTEFTNKELRLQLSNPMSPVKDNLETRLLLLVRRLEERCAWLRIERVARGRFRLRVDRPIELQEIHG